MSHVDGACESLLSFGQRFAKAMKAIFPKRRFIQFAAKAEPNNPLQPIARENARSG